MIAFLMDYVGRKPILLFCMVVAACSTALGTIASGESNWMFTTTLLITKSTVAGVFTLIR